MKFLYTLAILILTLSLVHGAKPEKKETGDYVSLRISARVIGHYTGRYSETSEDLSKNKTYLDAYTTSYTSVTQWKVKDLDQPDDVASLELVSDKPQVSGTGQGMMKEVTRRTVIEPSGRKRKATDIIDANWTYKFPQDNHPLPARVILHKKAKTFRIEMNDVGPDTTELQGKTEISIDGQKQSLPNPLAAPMGMALSVAAQNAAIPEGESDRRLTGKFDPEKPFAVSGMAVYNASEIPSYKMMMNSLAQSLGPGAVVNGDGKLHVSYTLAWNCRPTDIDAVIVPKADYESWLPAASKSGSEPGNAIPFEVRLIDTKTGKEPKDKTAYFQCDLLEVSKETGSCMNSPSGETEPDLKFLSTDNPDMETVAPDGRTAKSKEKLKKCRLSISSFDGGAYGKLKITAHLNDGRTLLAHLEGKEGDISLPYDEDGNHVADAWEEARGVKGKDPGSDDDEQPLGDRNKGDGLTLWEEYRGFLGDGSHFRTDPKKKDLFICDTVGGRSKRGINRFAALSKLDVHDKLTEAELDTTRVINRNHGEGPHVVDQHGLLLDSFSSAEDAGWAVGGPGTPRVIERVLIHQNLSDTVTRKLCDTSKTYEYYATSLAHELFHCCNVWHHGPGKDEIEYWKSRTVEGKKELFAYENQADIDMEGKGSRIFAFIGENYARSYSPEDPVWNTPFPVNIGYPQGEHSGNDDCLMRYDISTAIPDRFSRYCLVWECQEPVGQGLCASPAGTGVNQMGRKPFSRYVDAASGRGNCTDQICVNDLYH
ncbi:MAG: hypothetical protein NDI81_15155 [Desulfobacula sp.]|nr:hypothetical protein [Desulfobacula sp.]